MVTLLTLFTSVYSHTIQHNNGRPRAALVAFSQESQLPDMLSSMGQLEAQFNSKYHYDWVIFSNMELSDEFKEQTSNVTKSNCLFELVSHQHWKVPEWINTQRFEARLEAMASSSAICYHSGIEASVRSLPHLYRWNSGLFAQESRMRYYDWFWRVDPGVSVYFYPTYIYLCSSPYVPTPNIHFCPH
jgi:alpha 1,2-mannosyltransferase